MKSSKFLSIIIGWGFFLSLLNAQPYFPPKEPVFTDNEIAKIYIQIHPDSLARVFADVTSDHEYPATFAYHNSAISDTVEEVGFRLRGNTSRFSQKKSFKISINTFFPGRKFYTLEKLNINGEHNDPSIIRAKLSWNLFENAAVPAPRSHHLELYINDVYYGLYIQVEHIDENFVESRFGNNDGNLYKCLWPADLTYRGSDPEAYKFEVSGRRTYELQINEEADDYSDLADFITVLTQTPDNVFAAEIQKIFNVNSYLRMLAVDVAIGDWDGYWFNKNNFYLYHNTATGKFEYIPYDTDNTFGIWWDGILPGTDWGNRNIYNWGHPGEPRPLAERILNVPLFRDRFSFYLNKFLNVHFNYASLSPKIDEIHNMITPSAEADIFRTLDYGYTIEQFHDSYDQALGGHVTYGLTTYILTRHGSALSQLVLPNIAPIISYVKHTPLFPGAAQPINISAFVEDEEIPAAVMLHYQKNGVWQTPLAMLDDGQHGDGIAGDNIFGAEIPTPGASQTVLYYISARDVLNNESLEPFGAPGETFSVSTGGVQPLLFINEFMASNSATITDPFGEYDDWIEIYNGDSEAIWLGDKFLTDNLNNPVKWQLPDTTLSPGAFILIWADDQSGQGVTHAPYKLAKEGEEIGIFGADLAVIDSLSFGEQQNDISYGRHPDGSASWQFFSNATPGASNNVTGIQDEPPVSPETFLLLQNYPNPFNGETIIPFRLSQPGSVKIELLNSRGQKLRTLAHQNYPPGLHQIRWDGKDEEGNEAGSGIYFVRLSVQGLENSSPDKAIQKIVLIH